jgi:hypothetical protein
VARVAFVLLIAALVLAGCGGSKRASSTGANPFPQDPQIVARNPSPEARQKLDGLASDIRRIKAEAPRAKAGSRMGTPRLQRLTTSFLVDLKRSGVDLVSQNRIIDHAAAIAAPVCDQCWQMLEAERPIPAIAGH